LNLIDTVSKTDVEQEAARRPVLLLSWIFEEGFSSVKRLLSDIFVGKDSKQKLRCVRAIDACVGLVVVTTPPPQKLKSYVAVLDFCAVHES